VKHGDHIDYLHDGHLHSVCGTHVDEHARSPRARRIQLHARRRIPAALTSKGTVTDHPAAIPRFPMPTMSTTWSVTTFITRTPATDDHGVLTLREQAAPDQVQRVCASYPRIMPAARSMTLSPPRGCIPSVGSSHCYHSDHDKDEGSAEAGQHDREGELCCECALGRMSAAPM
jgi:hypothetical protein